MNWKLILPVIAVAALAYGLFHGIVNPYADDSAWGLCIALGVAFFAAIVTDFDLEDTVANIVNSISAIVAVTALIMLFTLLTQNNGSQFDAQLGKVAIPYLNEELKNCGGTPLTREKANSLVDLSMGTTNLQDFLPSEVKPAEPKKLEDEE